VRYLLDRIGGDPPLHVAEDILKRLMSYPWPGNVRELRNVLEREVILADGPELGLGSISNSLGVDRDLVEPTASLKEAERAHILRVLRSVGWNKKMAAGILGIGRPTIYDKIKQYGIKEGE